MKLTLCVPLIWMLFSSAEALKCVREDNWSHVDSSKDPELCNSTDTHCATVAYRDITNNILGLYPLVRTCAPSSLCDKGDQSISLCYDNTRSTASFQCCSSDGCNSKVIPTPSKQRPNGLQCVTVSVSDPSEYRTEQCAGIEDRCIIVNATDTDGSHVLRGCASASLCEGHTELKLKLVFAHFIPVDKMSFGAPECCDTSLCNSAPSDKLRVIPLLLALVALSWR
ncbi:urokinase plasminogen activator surface receptor-like isoform X3 [Halichoeres trimaculatus]